MQKSPVCFIAMAFGRDDTDLFYQRQILPVLKRNGVKPVIINRHQSNDDLNFQIFDQLDKADFCIADLTYTRPSVYFEAGYAQRSIPVIYTVRKDHLDRAQPDDLRVHFDLQMKPIVDWKNPDDPSFANRLEKRMRATILREWNRIQNENAKNENSKAEFQKLSQNVKLKQLRLGSLYAMRRVGIKMSQWKVDEYNFLRANQLSESILLSNGFVDHVWGATRIKNKIVEISVQAYQSLDKKSLSALSNAYYRGVSDNNMRDEFKKDIVLSHILVLSLKPVTAHQIETVFSSYTPLVKSKRYAKRFANDSLVVTKKENRLFINTYHFLTGIESEAYLDEMLNDLIDNYVLMQTNLSSHVLKNDPL